MNDFLLHSNSQPEPKPEEFREASLYTHSVQDAVALFDASAVPRTERSIQIYCSNGHLDCISVDSEHTSKYLISKTSIDRRISALQQIDTAKNMASKLRVISQTSAKVREDASAEKESSNDSRSNRESEIDFLREQVRVKDKQIASMLERDQETNILIKGLQDFMHKLPALQAPKYNTTETNVYSEYADVAEREKGWEGERKISVFDRSNEDNRSGENPAGAI